MFRLLLRFIKYTFLLTLPLTFFPLLSGTISGLLFGPWSTGQVSENIDKYLYETKDALDNWGVGGDAPTFREFQDRNNDFRVMRVNSGDWVEKMGFSSPREYQLGYDSPEPGIDKFADLESLVWDSRRKGRGKKETWLYLTTFARPSIDSWDAAFDEMIQRAYVDPKLNQSAFFFAECMGTAGFLCGIWHTTYPALVHFLVEDEPLDPEDYEGLTYGAPTLRLRPVTVRMIEFPFKEEYTGLSPSTFPSEKEQMLAIMTGDRLYEQFDPYFPLGQMFKQFNEYINALRDTKGTLLRYFDLLDNWMMDQVNTPLGIEEYMDILYQIAFSISAAISTAVYGVIQFFGNLFGEFLGRPKRGDYIVGEVDPDETPQDRFMEDMMGDFLKFVEKKMAEERTSSKEAEDWSTITTA